MATFSRLKTWVSNEVLTASDLNGEFDNIIDNMSPTGIEDASGNVSDMQAVTNPGGVGTESLATDLLGEIKRLRYKVKQIIGSAQWYSTPLTSLQASGVVTTSIADGAVTTVKIADGNVTNSKLAAVNSIVSGAGTGTTSSTSYVDLTNLSITITTVNRPVMVLVKYSGSTPLMNVSTNGNPWNTMVTFLLERSGSTAGEVSCGIIGDTFAGAITRVENIPYTALSFYDIPPSAGTYTYKLRAKLNSSSSVLTYQDIALLGYEI